MTKTIQLVVNVRLGSDREPVTPQTVPEGRSVLGQEGSFGSTGEGNDPDFNANFSIQHLQSENQSWGKAMALALCSKLTYSGESKTKDQIARWGFNEYEFISRNNTESFVASTDELVVVCFRGTQQIGDWITNFNIAAKSTPNGWVHRGFFFAFQEVRSQLESVLSSSEALNKKIILTGHSLGGALATIASMEWFGAFPVESVFTFGQPAVGFSSLRSAISVSYGNRFVRFVNQDDVVTRVPPGYRHAGKLIHFKDDGGISRESTIGVSGANDIETMSDQEFLELQLEMNRRDSNANLDEGLIPSVEDHALGKYLKKINDNGINSGLERSVFD